MEWLGRVGLLARGAVYAIVGVLAFKLAIGDGGRTASQEGAMRALAKEPNGTVLLVALAVGLAAYAAFRLASAWTGKAVDGLKERASALASGLFYALLCFTAVQILIGAHGVTGDEDKATGGLLGWTYGREIVGALGAIIVIEGIAQVLHGLRRKFVEKSRTDRMHAATERVFRAAGVAGHCARGVVFGLIGAFLVKAAVEYRPKETVALDGALAELADAPAGPVLLGIVSAGLVAFALYCFADARYRAL
jgi:hypothetical protein